MVPNDMKIDHIIRERPTTSSPSPSPSPQPAPTPTPMPTTIRLYIVFVQQRTDKTAVTMTLHYDSFQRTGEAVGSRWRGAASASSLAPQGR